MLVRNILLALGLLTLVVGIALFAILVSQTGSRPVSEAKAPVVQSAILVAARAIRTGTLLRADDITWRDAGKPIFGLGALCGARCSSRSSWARWRGGILGPASQ